MFYDITDRKRTETQFVQAVQEVMTDTAWFSRQVIERLALVRLGDDGKAAPVGELSKREREVLERVARGSSNEQIAQELVSPPDRPQLHLEHLRQDRGHSRAEAVVWARERGMV